MKELKGRLNTQQDEQFHSACRYDSRFFNNMKPVDHIFLFRSIIDLRNCGTNKKKISRIASLTNQRMSIDHLGRIILTTNDGFEEEMKNYMMDDPTKNKNNSEVGEKRKFMESLQLSHASLVPAKKQAITISINSDTDAVTEIDKKFDHLNVTKSASSLENTSDEQIIDLTSGYSISSKNMRYFDDDDLKLTNEDIAILMSSTAWVNDAIINASMTLLCRDQSRKFNGLQDVVLAQKEGFVCDPNVDSFLQIIHINGNHWVTISNVFCNSLQFETAPGHLVRPITSAKVYDSLQILNMKRGTLEYPYTAARSICELTKADIAIELVLENVQQQNGGNDCGLFAVAFATCIWKNINPCSMTFDQTKMRKAVLKYLCEHDMTRFIDDIVQAYHRSPPPEPLQHTQLVLHCHCRLPNDGNLIECKGCKKNFHEKCESGNFNSMERHCTLCREKEHNAKKYDRYWHEAHQKFIDAPETNFKNSQLLHKIYDKIRMLVQKEFQLAECKTSIGCVIASQILEILPNEKRAKLARCTIPFKAIAACFVCILPQTFENDQKLLETVVHEVAHCAHFLSGDKGRAHGAEFRQCGTRIIKTLKGNVQILPLPFCNCRAPAPQCLNAKCKYLLAITGRFRLLVQTRKAKIKIRGENL